MNERKYKKIYDKLKCVEDINKISEAYSVNTGAIANILHQKTVRNVRKYHSRIVNKAPKLVRSWKRGDTILELASKNNFPPALLASIMLREMGYKSKTVLKNPEVLEDKRLRYELIKAIDVDFCFSPRAHSVQSGQGRMGEDLIHEWLESCDLEFITESDMSKEPNTKTPDFLLSEPYKIEGIDVRWIESKAVFADEKEHNRYQLKQFSFYEDLFGPGMVVYWYGFLDTLVPNNYLITDYTFFEVMGYDVDKLVNRTLTW